MKPIKFSLNDCSWEKLVRLCVKGETITFISRHNHLKRPLVKGVVDALIEAGANITYK